MGITLVRMLLKETLIAKGDVLLLQEVIMKDMYIVDISGNMVEHVTH